MEDAMGEKSSTPLPMLTKPTYRVDISNNIFNYDCGLCVLLSFSFAACLPPSQPAIHLRRCHSFLPYGGMPSRPRSVAHEGAQRPQGPSIALPHRDQVHGKGRHLAQSDLRHARDLHRSDPVPVRPSLLSFRTAELTASQAVQPPCPVQSSLFSFRIPPPRTRWTTPLGEIAQCLSDAATGAVPAIRRLSRGSKEVRFLSLSGLARRC